VGFTWYGLCVGVTVICVNDGGAWIFFIDPVCMLIMMFFSYAYTCIDADGSRSFYLSCLYADYDVLQI